MGNTASSKPNSISISYNNPYIQNTGFTITGHTIAQETVHLSLNSADYKHPPVFIYLTDASVGQIEDTCKSLEQQLVRRYGRRGHNEGYLSGDEQLGLRTMLTYVGLFAHTVSIRI